MAAEEKERERRRIVKEEKQLPKKYKFVKDGVFYAELNDFLAKELAENGYAGCEIRVTPKRTEVTIRATQVLQVVGENGRRIRELTALVQMRFKFPRNGIFMFAEKVPNKGLSALAQAQAVKFRLLQGLSVRRAAYSVVQFIMNKGAQGCEVIVSGKLRGQRAKAMKFRDGFMIHAGDSKRYYVDTAVKHVHLRQGVIGIKVKIMLPHGDRGVKKPLPDDIKIEDPVEKSLSPPPRQLQQQPQQDLRGSNINNDYQGGQAPISNNNDDNQGDNNGNNNNNNNNANDQFGQEVYDNEQDSYQQQQEPQQPESQQQTGYINPDQNFQQGGFYNINDNQQQTAFPNQRFGQF